MGLEKDDSLPGVGTQKIREFFNANYMDLRWLYKYIHKKRWKVKTLKWGQWGKGNVKIAK